MYNWSVDEKKLQKDTEHYAIWQLEQMVNFGLRGKKLDTALLKRYLPKLHIDPRRREFLMALLDHDKRTIHQTSAKHT